MTKIYHEGQKSKTQRTVGRIYGSLLLLQYVSFMPLTIVFLVCWKSFENARNYSAMRGIAIALMCCAFFDIIERVRQHCLSCHYSSQQNVKMPIAATILNLIFLVSTCSFALMPGIRIFSSLTMLQNSNLPMIFGYITLIAQGIVGCVIYQLIMDKGRSDYQKQSAQQTKWRNYRHAGAEQNNVLSLKLQAYRIAKPLATLSLLVLLSVYQIVQAQPYTHSEITKKVLVSLIASLSFICIIGFMRSQIRNIDISSTMKEPKKKAFAIVTIFYLASASVTGLALTDTLHEFANLQVTFNGFNLSTFFTIATFIFVGAAFFVSAISSAGAQKMIGAITSEERAKASAILQYNSTENSQLIVEGSSAHSINNQTAQHEIT